MKNRYKVYLKLNLVSLFFIGVSVMSMTLAWFAYSGLASVQTEIDVKTWLIEFKKGEESVSNNIVISVPDIYPGMETTHESVKILNKGDSDASLTYDVISASILNETIDSNTLSSVDIKDKLSHDYPFNINIGLSKSYALAHNDYSVFDVSISWPLDSGNDELDSYWGSMAYDFQQNEVKIASEDSNYHQRASIKIGINVKAEQYLGDDNSSDIDFSQGKLILYDVVNNKSCDSLSDTCIKTHVLDSNNKVSDKNVNLIPDLLNNYSSGSMGLYSSLKPNWNVTMRDLELKDILRVVSNDVINSKIHREGLSDQIIGFTGKDERIYDISTKTSSHLGHFTYSNELFGFLSTNKCIWLNSRYDTDKYYAFTKIDNNTSKIYGESIDSTCSVVPVIVADKSNISF